ncbi:MAG: hypothetical protein KGJ78_16305 [Alphaproteobacteria bacterium]|nr:hypothetical protein [Alphaproteobacteria bacterium]
MSDLRGQQAVVKVEFGIKSKIVGALLVALIFGAAGTYFFTTSTSAAAKPVASTFATP